MAYPLQTYLVIQITVSRSPLQKGLVKPRTRRSTRFEDPWEGMTAAASMT